MRKSDPAFARVAEMEKRALDDYRAVAGKVFWATEVTQYYSDDFGLDKLLLVRVSATMMDHQMGREDVFHWNDEWLDPIWQVDILAGLPENLAGMYDRYTWVDSNISYNRITGERRAYECNLMPLSWWDRVRLRCGLIGRSRRESK